MHKEEYKKVKDYYLKKKTLNFKLKYTFMIIIATIYLMTSYSGPGIRTLHA